MSLRQLSYFTIATLPSIGLIDSAVKRSSILMSHLVSTTRSFKMTVRRHARTIVLCVILFFISSGTGFYLYARHEWDGAKIALKENRFAEAQGKLDLCLWVWPRSVEVHLLAARAARLQGDYPAAEAHLNKCLKLQHGASEATQVEFLLMRAQTGEEDEVATPLFAYVDNNHPETEMILKTIARAYMHRYRFGPAYDCLSKWIDVAPNSAQAYHWRGWVLERLNNRRGAMDDYQRALELDPALVDVQLHIAEMLMDENQPLDAIPYLEPLHKRFPDRADILARLGQCRYMQGQPAEARQLLEAAAEQRPDDSTLLLYLAKLDLDQGKPVAAEARLRHALEVEPSDAEARFTLVTALQYQDHRNEAAQALAQYEKQKKIQIRVTQMLNDEASHPSQGPNVPAEIGTLLLDLGRKQQGIYWLEQALQRDPRHQASHKALADYYEKQGEPERAAVHRRMLRKAP